ncbi:MAG: methyltransferase domain-containing protein [Micrococcales bacterium]|nr:methyltransferase domain-containing protein [Micrococcales bacterium]
MQCDMFDAGVCRSCTAMGRDLAEQLAAKHAAAVAAVPMVPVDGWAPPFAGAGAGYRNRAKLVVAGSLQHPTLGILDEDGRGVDLTRCGLYEPALAASFGALRQFVTRAAIEPYDVPARRGELKYLLVTVSPDGALMVRFVLRSTEALARVAKHLPWLHEALGSLVVASVNIQPVHAAVLEGEREVVLTPASTLAMRVGGVTLHLPPRSFFQTNTAVAAELYRQAAVWADGLAPTNVADLYCGVGGFAAHLAAPGRHVVGVETSAAAVAAARTSAPGATFVTGDAAEHVRGLTAVPDLVVVNPPRRGLGDLAAWLQSSTVPHVLYSSCHLPSLVADLAAMPALNPVRARVLDMFPQTAHAEVLVLLARQ